MSVFERVSCSDSIRLQQQLEELQIQFVALQNKTADYESVQTELKEKKVQYSLLNITILYVLMLLSNSQITYLRSLLFRMLSRLMDRWWKILGD